MSVKRYDNLNMSDLPDKRGVKLCPTLIIHANMNNPKSRYPMVTVTGKQSTKLIKKMNYYNSLEIDQ